MYPFIFFVNIYKPIGIRLKLCGDFDLKNGNSSAVSMTDSAHFHCTWICDDCAAKIITRWLENVANDVYYHFGGEKCYPSLQCVGGYRLTLV